MVKVTFLSLRSLFLIIPLITSTNLNSIFSNELPDSTVENENAKPNVNTPNGVKLITYDFRNDLLDSPRTVGYNSLVGFQIKNINTFLYNITVTPEQKSYNNTPPDILKTTLSKTLTLPDDVASMAKKGGPGIRYIDLEDQYAKVLESIKNLQYIQVFYDKLTLLVQTENLDADQIINGKHEALYEFITKSIGSHIFDPKNCENTAKLYGCLDSLFENYNQIVKQFKDALKQSIASNKKNLADAEEELRKAQAMKKKTGKADAIKKAEDDKKTYTERAAMYELLGDNIEKSKEEVQKANFPNLIEQTVTLYSQINESSFNYVSSFKLAKEDEIDYTVKIEPKTNLKFSNAKKMRDFPVNVDVEGGIRFSFSTGLFTTELDHNRYSIQNQYNIANSDSVTGYKIIQQDVGKFKIGLCALAHVNIYNFHNVPWVYDLSIGPNLGVGILDNGPISYLLGANLILGQDHRFIIAGGAAIGQIDVLSESLPMDRTYKTVPTISTQKKTEWKPYIAITYNL